MQQNDALRKELEDERARSKAQLRDLECKLRDLQEQLMGKVKDFNQARDAQASLRNEIETYRQLLEADDMRYVIILIMMKKVTMMTTYVAMIMTTTMTMTIMPMQMQMTNETNHV